MPRFSVLIICAGLAIGQPVLPLSLQRAVEIALAPAGSTRVALAEQTIKQAQARQAEARAALLPNLSGSITDRRQTLNLRTFGFDFQLPGFSFPSVVGPFSVFDARATASQTIFDFSSLRSYQAARVNVSAAQLDFDAAKNQVADQVARAYLTALRADASLETVRANVELSSALQKLAEQQKEAGTGTGIEVTRAQVQLANDRQRLLVAENDRRRAVLNLLRAMGLKLDAHVELTGKLSYQAAEGGSLDEALAAARKVRAELKAQKQREDAARLTYGAAKWDRLPSIAASADYGSIGSELVGAQPTYSYGVSLRVPVFNGGRGDARRAETESQYRQERTRTHDLEEQVDLEVRLAFDSIRSAAAQVQAAREGVQLAQNELAQARRRYEAGVANSIELIDAQTRLDRAGDNHIAALYNYNLARMDLATATGSIREFVNQ